MPIEMKERLQAIRTELAAKIVRDEADLAVDLESTGEARNIPPMSIPTSARA